MTGTTPALVLPELGPLLGKLAAADASDLRDRELEPVRLELLTAVFDRAGRARELVARGDAVGALTFLGRETWLEIWERAVAGVTAAVMTAIERQLREAATVSRIGRQRLAARLPSAEDRRILAARLSAAGMGLERRSIELGTSGALWGDTLRVIAGELAAAWEIAATLAHQEFAFWDRRIAEVRAWRRPWRPLAIGGATAIAVATWLGLVLGGYLPAPGFLKPLADWYWSIGWP